MSNDIRAGDVCEVIRAPLTPHLVGAEVEVLELERTHEKALGPFIVMECFGYLCRSGDGRRFVLARECLRKKRPPADPEQWIRQDTVPRERFDHWLDQVRHGAKITETAEP